VLRTGENPAAAGFLSDNAVLARYLPAEARRTNTDFPSYLEVWSRLPSNEGMWREPTSGRD
jgi:hypothetical protein